MSKVQSIHKKKAKFPVVALCLACFHKWVGCIVAATNAFGLKCPECGEGDSFVSFLPDRYVAEVVKK